MSSVGRAASRGSKSGKGEHATASAKAQKTDTKTETAKSTENPKAQPTPEQMRLARIIDGKYEDPQLEKKIKQVMDATHKSETEALYALHDCDYDLNKTVNMLIEGQITGEWETSSKKKKNRQPSANSKPDVAAPRGNSSADVNNENWDDETVSKPPAQTDSQQRTRGQRGAGGGGPPRMRGRGSQDNRGWRGRENKENERNLEENRNAGVGGLSAGGDRDQRDSFRRGGGSGSRGGRMSNGGGRGGGRGGSRTGPRSFSRGGAPFPRATAWNPDEDGADSKSNNFPSTEDWDNEEYTGSLSDTKVFTPSNVSGDASSSDAIASLTVNNSNADPSMATSAGVSSTTLNYAQSAAGGGNLSAAQTQYLRQLPDNKLASSKALSGAMSGLNSMAGSLANATDSKTATRGITPSAPPYNSYAASAANSAANASVSSSYPSSYSSVSASAPPVSSSADTNYTAPSTANSNFSTYPAGQTQPASYTATATSYSTVYGSHQDGSTQAASTQALPPRSKTQRPRVPPPSKIPQSAVEMPGDGVNTTALDVQFGGLDFGTEAFDINSSDPQSSPQSNQSSQSQNQQSPMTKYSSGASSGSGLDTITTPSQPNRDLDAFAAAGQKAAALSQTLKETLLQGPQSQQTQSNSQSQSNDLKSQTSNFSQQSRGPVGVVPSPLDSLVKSDPSSVGSVSSVSASGATATGSLSYSTPNSNYQSSYTSQKGGYQSSAAFNSASYPSSQAASGVSASSSNSYPTSYPSNASSQAYQNVQSVYGASSNTSSAPGGNTSGPAVGSTSGYTASSSTGGYQNSYGTSAASAAGTNKLTSALNAAKDLPQYDTTATSTSNLSGPLTSSSSGAPGLSVPNASGSVNSAPSLGLQGTTTLPNANNATSTKVTNSSAKSVVQNMPPGVQPIIAGTTQYIMSQGGLPFFQQPAVYGYDEQQLMPLRIPHMPGYYDLSYQGAPTSLATGREGSLANVPYSMSDARFARTDNASPVPSSLSQQTATQAHQQPLMNAAGFPPGYAYAYYSGSVVPANYQYGTPTAMYPQVAQATNAHGNSNSTQYPKPGSYGGSYGSGYEGLSASQDYSKGGGGYAGGHSGGQTASKAGVGTNVPSTGSSTDIYNKSHAALGKVNSYDKGFHSGTPPPFNLAGNQNTGMTPSGAFPPTPLYIPPPIPQQHHHSTTLMQHPVHQQMDMRNSSRRSESGNNSGQRSQSSTQSNKPGSKQVYASQNYWTN